MSTSYPGALDAFNNPSSSDNLNTAGVLHDVQHSDANDAIEALERKLGIDPSGPTVLTGRGSIDSLVRAYYDIRAYGAVPDTIVFDAVITGGSRTITSATANWQAGDVGKTFYIRGKNVGYAAGLHARHVYHSTIETRNSASSIVALSTDEAPFAGVGAAMMGWGSDNGPAIQAAIDAAAAAGGGTVLIPSGSWLTNQTIVLKLGVQLQGTGRLASVIRLGRGVNNPIIKNDPGNSTTTPPQRVAALTGIFDLQIDGNCDRQSGSATTAHGVYFSADPFWAQNTTDVEFDTLHRLHNVYIVNVRNTGYRTDGRQVTKLSNVDTYFCNGNGFDPGVDHHMVNCEAGQSGLEGFLLNSPGVTLASCKSFYSGNITASRGDGFLIDGVTGGMNALAACEAQDNKAHGYHIKNSRAASLSSCGAESNSTSSAGTYVGFCLDGCFECIVEAGTATERFDTTSSTQRSAVMLINSAVDNRISCSFGFTFATASKGPAIHSSSTAIENNDVRINAQQGVQTVAYAATITPDVYRGGTIKVGALTGNLTVNAPSTGHTGCELTFLFVQDATGGRTITWNSAFKSAFQPNSKASSRSVVKFKYDGTNWLQIGSDGIDRAVGAARWHETITFTNMQAPGGSAISANTWGNIFVGANGQRQVANFTGYTQYRVLLHYNQPASGAGTLQFRVVDQVTQTNVLHSFAGNTGTGEIESDSGWADLPAWAGGDAFIVPQIQANNTTTDPIFRSLAVYLR